MKQYGILCVIVAIIMLLTPIVALSPPKTGQEEISEGSSEVLPSGKEFTSKIIFSDNSDSDVISVFMSEDSTVEQMDMRDYIIGVVAAEMPASYEAEALKVQALVAVTYAQYRKKFGSDEDIGGADISDDSDRHQGYMTVDEMKEKWSDTFESYYSAISDAVDAVIDKSITYKGEPILAAYHAISSGKTESALKLWGKDIPYLRSVDSEWDKNSARYSTEVILTPQEIQGILSDTKGTDFSGNEEDWIKIKRTSDSGTVLEAELCGVKMTGMEMRNILSLRSPVFEVEYTDEEFVFSVYGYGHGVGLSQNGANCMAKDGKTYEDIIAHYYPGTEIV